MAELVANLPRVIAEAIAVAVRTRLELDEDTCYLAAAPAWIDGSPHQTIVQIIPGDSRPWSSGDGGQEGGNVFREQSYIIALWYVVAMDPHQMTEHALTEAADGILDYTERVRTMLTGATFADADGPLSQQIEQMRYRGESTTQVIDPELSILMRTITFSVPYAVPLVDHTETIGAELPA